MGQDYFIGGSVFVFSIRFRIPTALIILAMLASYPLSADDASDIRFPAQRQALKVVWGEDGSDIGDLSGRGCRLLAHMADFGINLTRVGVGWADAEKIRGQDYDWSASDEMVNFLLDRGVEPLLVITGCPEWARRTHPEDAERARELGVHYVDLQMPLPQFYEDYKRWAAALAARYKGRVRYYEFWNEWDGIPGPVLLRDAQGRLIGGRTGGDAVVYAQVLKAVHDGLKQGNPEAMLAAGSLSVQDTNFMEAVYCTVGKDAFEAISYHPYARAGIDLKWLRALRQLSIRYGDPECEHWITEYDWTPASARAELTTTYGCGEAAEVVPSNGVTLGAHYPYVTQLYLHTLNDWGPDPGGPLPYEGFGLLNLRLEKKPKYDEYGDAILWRNETLARELALHGPNVVFPGVTCGLEVECSLAEDIGELEWFVPDDWSVSKSPEGRNRYVMTVPRGAASDDTYPITARNAAGFCFNRYIEVVEPLQLSNVTIKEGARSSSPCVVQVLIQNLSGRALKGMLEFDLPAGWQAQRDLAVHVPAGSSAAHAVSFHAAKSVKPGVYEAAARLLLEGRVCGRYSFQLIREAGCQFVSEPKKIDGDLSDWGGAWWVEIPGSASPARFAACWDRKALYVAVQVEDDRHVQSRSILDAWHQDSVQIAFDTLCDAVPGSGTTTDDYELIFALMPEGPRHYRYRCPPDSYGGEAEGIDFQAAASDGLTTYEMSFAWSELKPAGHEIGEAVGMCVVVNDSDGGERTVSSWGGGVAETKMPIRYGRIRLVGTS